MKNANTLNSDQLLEEAVMAIEDQHYARALHLLNVYLLVYPDHMDARLQKGLCYLYLNEAPKARYMFDQVLEEEEHHAGALACYAEYYKLMMDYETASHYISAAMAGGDENAAYHRLAAEISYLNQDLDSAYTLINRAIVISPFREELYFWRALILKGFKKMQVAMNDINRALALNPRYTEALKLRAKIRMIIGTFDAANKDLRLAQHLENRLPFAMQKVA